MTGYAIDLSGQTKGRWLVVGRCGSRGEKADWLCRCACGVERVVSGNNLRSGASQSCGCWNREITSARRTIHGERAGSDMRESHRSAEYRTWLGMKRRCKAASGRDFRDYTSRGITVCGRWRNDFAAFLADMGRRPSPARSIDRIDTNGHYEPGNCRWATMKQQARNRRSNRSITALGETLIAIEWSERTGIALRTITSRVLRGWSDHDAVTVPLMASKSHRPGQPSLRATASTRTP